MIFYVDADSFPSPARNLILKTAVNRNTKVIFAANRKIPFSIESPLFFMQICESKEGAADDYIFENAAQDDIVFTRDIPLAKRLVEKDITVLNDRGTEFTKENINQRLIQRELSMAVCFYNNYSKKSDYGKKELKDFADCFNRVLSKK